VTPKTNKSLTSAVVLFGVALIFSAILYLVDSFSDSLGIVQWLNSGKIMRDHKSQTEKLLADNPHFESVNKQLFIKEVQRLVSMEGKRDLGDWISYRSFTPDIKGEYFVTNDFGLRSDNSLKDMVLQAQDNKQKGNKNILLLGGSTAFGLGATDESKTITSLLNSTLKKDGFEVFNLAQGGYTSFMQLFMLSNIGIHFESDLIIILGGYSDFYHLAYKSKGGNMSLGLWDFYNEKSDPSFVFNLYLKNLDIMGKLGTSLGNKIIYAIQPISGYENDSLLEVDKIEKLWDFYPKVREVTHLAARANNATFLDLSQLFKNENNSEINFYDKSHLSNTGQKKVAAVLLRQILALSQDTNYSAHHTEEKKVTADNILAKDYSEEYKTARDY